MSDEGDASSPELRILREPDRRVLPAPLCEGAALAVVGMRVEPEVRVAHQHGAILKGRRDEPQRRPRRSSVEAVEEDDRGGGQTGALVERRRQRVLVEAG